MKKNILLLCVIALFAASCQKNESVIHVKEVSLDKEEVSVLIGKTQALTVTILPKEATNKSVIWASENEAVATISDKGVITGVGEGKTNVTVASVDGNYMAACKVYVTQGPVSVASVSLNQTTLSIKDSETFTLVATVLPENATDKTVTWTSSDTDVVTVSSKGVLTPYDAGTANVTVTTTDGKKKATCKVTVQSTHTRKRPVAGGSWTVTNVADGMVWYNYHGRDNVTGTIQNINVVDIDTSKYALKFYFDNSQHLTSDVLRTTKSLLAMNAAYERASIYVKTDNIIQNTIENDEISTTGVANWKNDGAICVTKDGYPSFMNTIYREADSKGSGSYGLSLKTQRDVYRSHKYMDQHFAAYSSAPLMIFKYKPLGLTFVPTGKTYYNPLNQKSEDPYNHQTSTHPRTVVALDGDGRLLMITADGRQSNWAIGISCKNLTRFLIDNFDPRFALNMDGGGSTDLCIAGYGEETTHVVNRPIDSSVPGKERTLSTFFYIVKR